MKLTAKQEAFAQSIANKKYDYIWEAYAAHYDVSAMKQNVIYVKACELLKNGKVLVRIAEIEKEIHSRSMATLDEVIRMMSKRMRVSAKDFFDSEGSVKAIQDLTDDQAMCIVDFKAGPNGELKEVKLESIRSVWDMFLKKYGAYINVNVEAGKGVLSDEARGIIGDITE